MKMQDSLLLFKLPSNSLAYLRNRLFRKSGHSRHLQVNPKHSPSESAGFPTTMMDIDYLPDKILHQIFQYLPIDQQVRAGRASLRFHHISDLVISETTHLDLNNPVFQRIRPSGLSCLLDRCRARLEGIIFPRSFDRSLIEAFGQFSCPRLTQIRVDHTRIGNELFGDLLRNNQNLRRVTWNHSSASPVFPEDSVFENLEAINISCFNDDSFRSLTGLCPNLTYFETEIQTAVSRDVLDDFFAEHHLQQLVFREMTGNFSFSQLSNFWQLTQLRILIVCGDPLHRFTDAELIRISVSFPLLEELGLVWLSVTKEAVAALATLENLLKLAFENTSNTGDGDIDEAIACIAQRGRLQELQYYNSISPATLRILLTSCPQLELLCIWKVKGVITPEQAVEIIQSLEGTPNDVNARIRICHEVSAFLWKSRVVTTAVEQLGSGEIQFESGEAIRFWDSVN